MDRDDIVLAYVQGALSAVEKERFVQQIAEDDQLAAEVAALTATRTSLTAEKLTPPAGGWDRFSKTLDEKAKNAANTARPANDNQSYRFSPLQVACLVGAAVLAWQVLAVPLLNQTDARYDLASQNEEKHTLQIGFAPAVSIADISKLLISVEGSLIAGPSSVGLYRVRFKDDAARDKAAKLLKERSDLVEEVLAQ